MYKLNYDKETGKVTTIRRTLDCADIAISEGNSDYKDFLIWNAKQVTPLDLNSTIEVVVPEAVVDEVAILQEKVAILTKAVPKTSLTAEELAVLGVK